MPMPAAPRPIWPTTRVAERRARPARRVQHGRERDDRGCVLIVVQHRPVEARTQARLDLEAGGRREILELYRAEARGDRWRRESMQRAGSFSSSRIGTALMPTSVEKSAALPSMTGRLASAPDVAEPEYRRAVGHDRDRIAEARVLVRERGVLLNGEANPGDARRVDVAQHLLRRDRDGRLRAQLSTAVPVEHAVRLADEARDGQRVDAAVEAAIRLLVHLQRDLPERAALLAPQRLQVVDRESRIGDHLQHTREAARLVHGLDDQDLGYLHARNRTRSVVTYAVVNPPGVTR